MPEEIVPVVLELADQHGPFGARGVAEMPLVPFLPAVAAAIHDAIGVWLTEQPFTPERVLASLSRPIESRSAMIGHHWEGSARLSQLLRITAGPFEFVARVEEAAAPKTCAAFLQRLPFQNQNDSCPLERRIDLDSVWATSTLASVSRTPPAIPPRDRSLLYPGGYSETEILFPYGACCFASKMGQLAGNHFLTIVEGNENLAAIGTMCLWKGAQDVVFERA